MAQLKDTLVSGDLRVTDILYSDTVQADTINAKTSSSATTYGPGTSGQVLKSNGTFSYWDAESAVDNTKVAKAGDTMTGDLTMTKSDNMPGISFNGSASKIGKICLTSDGTNFDLGWNYSTGDGALAYFRGKDYATIDDQGAFGLRARKDTSGYKELKGTVDGTLKWTGDNLRINNDNVGISVNNSGKNMDFGWAWTDNKGAGAYFRAADYSSGDNQGQFGFFARNASATKQLIGSASGALTWGGNSIYHAGNLPDQLKVPRVATDANSDIAAANTLVVKEHQDSSNNLPVSNKYWHIYSAQGTDGNYQTQLALGMTTDKPSLFTRQKKSNTWGNWAELCTSATGPVPMFSNTYSGLIGSANDAANASFYFGHIIPTDYYDVCKIHFRFYVTCAGTDSAAKSARSMHDCWIEISWNALRTYSIYNSITSTDYRAIYYINIYRANNTGIAAGCGHLIGAGLRSSWNRTTAASARTIKVEILETVNCTYTPFENALKYADVPGTGSTNYSGLTEANAYSSGLQESGDADTIDRIRFQANIKSGSVALVAGNIIVAGTDGLYKHLKLGTAFDIKYPILYCNANLAVTSAGSNNYLVIHFTITTTQSISMTAYKPIYIKGTLSGSTFTPISTTPLTQTEPTTEDGYQYMLLGISTASTTAYLTQDHRIFEYKNGAFREYNAIEGYWSASISKAVGDTSVTISHTQITANSVIDAYTSNSTGTPISMTSIVSSAGSVTINFPALTVATDFRVHIMNV